MQKLKKGEVPTPAQLIAVGKYKKPERPTLSADSIRTNLSKNLYNLASLFYSELDVPDSAYFYFNKILSEYPDKPVKVQTMYALATYYETHDDSVKADSLFQFIYNNFKKDPLGSAAAQKLGLIKKEEKIIDTKKVDDPAEKHYDVAEQLYYSKKYTEAIDTFRFVYKKFPESSFAPKSVYYMGMIYENELKLYDSAASAYQILTKDFSKSPLASTVVAKYTEYKKEKDLIKLKEETARKEQEAKQKEKEKIIADAKKVEAEIQPVQSELNKRKIIGNEAIKSTAVKDSTFKKDTLELGGRIKSIGDSLKTKNDSTKIKRPLIEK